MKKQIAVLLAGLCVLGLSSGAHADIITIQLSLNIEEPVNFRMYYEGPNGVSIGKYNDHMVFTLRPPYGAGKDRVRIERPQELKNYNRVIYMSRDPEFPEELSQQEVQKRVNSKDILTKWYRVNVGTNLGFLTGPLFTVDIDKNLNWTCKASK